MFDNIIKFIAPKPYIDNNQDYLPTPIKLNIPEWYKKLEHTPLNKTVKGCMPFLDSLTTGYVLKMPVDYLIRHNIEHEGERKTGMLSGTDKRHEDYNINFGQEEWHSIKQLKGSPHVEKNKNLPVHKILNPWIIKTPPGYSTLFVPPLNNSDDRFSIIPAIVDTDTFENEINFPFIVNGDKYPVLESTIEIGTPYVQLIPFKRESWSLKIESINPKENHIKRIFNFKHIIHNYKKLYWHKKKWK